MTARAILTAAVLALLATGQPAYSQGYPDRPVTLIIPFAPGGGTDVLARALGPIFAAKLGGTVVIENVSGGAGNIASTRVARAAPDGYTLVIHNVGFAINASLYRNLPFDSERDFLPVAFINYSPLVIMGRKTLPANTLPELVAWMKENPAKLAHAGIGSISHLAIVPLMKAAGQGDLIPYRGGGPAVQDVIAGHADLTASPLQTGSAPVSEGLAKGFAVTSAERSPMLPDVPSLVPELGPQAETTFWNLLMAPAGTPKAVTDKLNAALDAALSDPQLLESFAKGGATAYAKEQRTLEGAQTLLRREIAHWRDVIRDNKIEAP